MKKKSTSFWEDVVLPRIAEKLGEFPIDGTYDNKLFPNGFAMPMKEGRIAIIESGGQWSDFFLNMNGYAFAHEMLPDHTFAHEMDKWWVMPNPENETKITEIGNFFSKNQAANKMWNELIKDSDVKAALVNNSPQKKLSNFKQNALDKSGIFIFQDWTGQKKRGDRKIQFYEYRNQKIELRDEISPYYFATEFPYGFEVTDQEDSEYIPTKMQFVIRAMVINPYAAHIKSGKPFTTFEGIVTGTASEVIRMYPCHQASTALAAKAGKTATHTPEEVQQEIKKRIMEELNKEENFFGFYFTGIEIVQTEMSGENAKALKEATSKIYLSEQDQLAQDIANTTNYNKVVKEADANLEKRKKENEGETDLVTRKGNAEITLLTSTMKAISDAGGNPDLELVRRIVGELPENSILGNPLGDILEKFITKK